MFRSVVLAQFRLILAVVALSLLRTPAYLQLATAWTKPELPRMYVDTAYGPSSGKTIALPAGGDFQAALTAARAGDVITLEAGATFTGPFTLPNKSGSGWITIRTSASDRNLPPQGTRVDPAYAKVMPKLEAGSGSVITAVPGAHHYRFIGIEIRPRGGVFLYNLVLLGSDERSVDQLPHHIIFDRCYLHGDPVAGGRRGIAMNSASTAVIDSYLSDFKEAASDGGYAISGWNGIGPFKIVNNYLEAAGVNVFFGGWDPTIPGLVPSDIEIRGNHFFKPLTWKIGDPTYAGTPWVIKNLFELKNAQRVLVDGNIFEHNWIQADQHGAAILFTVRNQNGAAPWSIIQDVTFTHNIVRHATGGMEILGWNDTFPSQQTQRVLIQSNLFVDIGGATWAGLDRTGRLFQLTWGPANVIIDHNTAFQTENPVVVTEINEVIKLNTDFVFTNNITPNGPYGVAGDNTFGNPLLTLNTYFPGYVFDHNVLPGGNPSSYPPDNFFPSGLAQVGFVNYGVGDYQLAASSPYKKAGTDGKDIGADIDALSAATATAITGAGFPVSPPHPTLSVTPQAMVNFGSVAVGTSVERSFTVTNAGWGALSGTASSVAPFSVVSGDSFSLAPGASQTVVVRFSPTAVGSFGVSVNFTWNGGSASRIVTGTGMVATPSRRRTTLEGVLRASGLPVVTFDTISSL